MPATCQDPITSTLRCNKSTSGLAYSIVVVAEGAFARDGARALQAGAAAGHAERLGGVGEQVLSYDDIGEGYSISADLVFDLWAPGAEVTVSAPGSADIGGFEMSAVGPDDFADVSPNQEIPLDRAGTTISWTPGNGTQIVAYLRNSGGNQVIRCTSPDDGSVEVPAEAFGWIPANVNQLTLDLRRASRARVGTPEPVGDVYLVLERIHTDRRLDLED